VPGRFPSDRALPFPSIVFQTPKDIQLETFFPWKTNA
jgi:hypothetical protein